MNCPNCGHGNAAESSFCSNCGTKLAIECPACGTEAAATANFCNNCGAALGEVAADGGADDDRARYVPEELLAKMRAARSGHAMEGERRTVTMLFADIKGSTAAAERLDPEDWAEIINGAFEHLIAPVYRYEGTLARLQGDAVLAFFGAPIAHEDDPIRAIRAGLEIIDAMARYGQDVEENWGIPIEVRVGINTGLVVVGEVGSDLRVEYTALGDAINLAARMEQTAEPGTVQVTQETLALTGGAFTVEALGPVEVKGKSRPVETFRPLRFVDAAVLVDDADFVGREDETEVLVEQAARLAGGSGWILSIIGEAGVGKSRLLDQLRSHVDEHLDPALGSADTGEVSWLFGSSRSYNTTIPFATMADLLGRWWGSEGEAPQFSAVAGAAAAAGLEDPDAAAYLGYIAGATLSTEAGHFIEALETPALHAKAAATLSSYFAGEARRRPTFIVFEDLHWADDLSLAAVEELMALTETLPLGLVIVMRPDRDEPTWRIHEVAARDYHHRYRHLDLDALPVADGEALFDSLMGDTAISSETRAQILDRAGGNPLFIEEMARSLGELDVADVEQTEVPASLIGMLTARLDRLDDESRLVIQTASVLGAEFDTETLSVLLDGTESRGQVTTLLQRGFLAEAAESPGMLVFRHALMQQAAYATILRRTRRDLHHRVADYLIASHPERVQRIAHHLLTAGDPPAAFPYLLEAGNRATRSMALASAIDFYSKAIDAASIDTDPALVAKAHEGLGAAHSMVPDLSRSAAAYQRLYDYGEEVEQPSVKVAALNRLAFTTASLGHDLISAQKYLEDARQLALDCGDEIGLAEYHMNACFVASLGGNVAEAVAHDEATVALGKKQGVDWIRLSGTVRRAINYASLLDFDNAEPAIQDALNAAAELGLEEAAATVDSFGSVLLELRVGDLTAAVAVAERAQEDLVRYSSFYVNSGHVMLGQLLYEAGEVENGLSHFTAARRGAAQMGQPFTGAAAEAGQAHVYATCGFTEPIAQLRSEAIAAVEGPLGEFLASTVWADLGYAALEAGDIAQADADFARGREASSYSQFIERPRLLIGRALAQAGLGDIDKAQLLVAETRQFVEEKDIVPWFAAGLAYAEGEVSAAAGDFEDAAGALDTAQQAARGSGERLLLLRIHNARRRVASASGDVAAAEEASTAASTIVAAIAEAIADETLRGSFTRTWRERLTATAV